MLAKSMELGRRIVSRSRDGHPRPPRVDPQRDRGHGPHGQDRSTRCRTATRPSAWSRDALARRRGAGTCWSPPALRADRGVAKAAEGEAAELLDRAADPARRLQRAARRRRVPRAPRLGPRRDGPAQSPVARRGASSDADLDARRRRAAGAPALARRRPRRRVSPQGYRPDAAEGDAAGAARRAGQALARAPDLGQPPARRGDRQEVRQPRHEPAGPRPGGQRRADARRRQVRVRARLQVLDLRDVVDPPGDPARPRGPVADDPHPGPHGRDDDPRHAGHP